MLEGLAWRPDKISPAIEVLEIFGPGKLLSKVPLRVCDSQNHPSSQQPNPKTPTQPCAMPSMLGKRKSRPVEEEPEALADAQELLRRHFEARFKPLAGAACAAPNKPAPATGRRPTRDDSQRDDSSDSDADAGHSGSDWSGVSSGDDMDEDDEEEDDDHDGGMRTNGPTLPFPKTHAETSPNQNPISSR